MSLLRWAGLKSKVYEHIMDTARHRHHKASNLGLRLVWNHDVDRNLDDKILVTLPSSQPAIHRSSNWMRNACKFNNSIGDEDYVCSHMTLFLNRINSRLNDRMLRSRTFYKVEEALECLKKHPNHHNGITSSFGRLDLAIDCS